MLGRCNNRKSIVISTNYGNYNALTAGHCLGYLLTVFDGFCKNAWIQQPQDRFEKSTKPWHYEQYHQQHPERFFVLLGGGYMSNFTIVVNWCHKNCALQSVKLCKWHPESNKHNSASQKLPPTDPIVSQTAGLDSVWCSLTKSWNCPSPLFHSLGHFTLRNPGPCP